MVLPGKAVTTCICMSHQFSCHASQHCTAAAMTLHCITAMAAPGTLANAFMPSSHATSFVLPLQVLGPLPDYVPRGV